MIADTASAELCDIISRILHSLPREAQEAFKLSEPKFSYIPSSYDVKKSIQRTKELKESFPHRVPDLPASHFLFQLSKDASATIRPEVAKAIESLNRKLAKYHETLSMNDILYLARVWAFFSEKNNGRTQFQRYYSRELKKILMTNPLNNINVYQGVLFHFRADDDRFDIKKGIYIRRLYPWEYSEYILEILRARHWLRPPALETLAEANFILEVEPSVLGGNDDWAGLHDLRRLVDIISVASKGHVWTPYFMIRKGALTQWNEGVRGSDFSGLIGVIPAKQKSIFMNRVRKGLDLGNNVNFESVCRSLRQEEDYGFEFRLVRLFSSLEILVGSTGMGCGMRLAWLLGKEPKLREEIFKEFMGVKKLRDKIIHKVLLYDLMTSEQKSDTLNSIERLHNWLFDAIAGFLDHKISLEKWQDDLSAKLFGGQDLRKG